MSVKLVWKEIQDAGIDVAKLFGVSCSSEQELARLLCPESGLLVLMIHFLYMYSWLLIFVF